VVTTASGRARALALVDDGDGGKGLVFGDDIIGGERGSDERARGPFWCSAALGEAGGVVAFGSSGNHLVCADVDGDGVMTRRCDGDALGPHTGYVRSVVYSRALRRAYSCACNFIPCWIWDDATQSLLSTPEREHLKLFTGDVLKLCVFDDRVVFAGVADGTVRAFDVSRPREPKDLGTLGDARANERGRVVALAVCGDTFIVSGSHDGRVEVHDAMDVRSPALARLDIPGGKIHAVARLESHVLVAGDFGVKILAFNANDSTLAIIDDAFAGITTSARAVAVVDESSVLVGDALGSTTLQSLGHKYNR
jgi:WD40 repeat protein